MKTKTNGERIMNEINDPFWENFILLIEGKSETIRLSFNDIINEYHKGNIKYGIKGVNGEIGNRTLKGFCNHLIQFIDTKGSRNEN